MIDLRRLTRKFHDPDALNLRTAVRAAIVMPAVFAFGRYGLHDATAALFAAFGAFAALVLANFGGTPPRRFLAYAALAVVGAGLVALGTVVAPSTPLTVITTLFVVFAIIFAGVLGGYWDAGANAAILAFVLAASFGARSELGSREIGWLIGAGVSAIAAVGLWPCRERRRARTTVAYMAGAAAHLLDSGAAGALDTGAAGALDTGAAGAPASLDRAEAALHALTGIQYRPIGTARADRGLKMMTADIKLIATLCRRIVDGTIAPAAGDDELRGRIAETLPRLPSRSPNRSRPGSTRPRCSAPGRRTALRSTIGPAPRSRRAAPRIWSTSSTVRSRFAGSRCSRSPSPGTATS